MRRACSTRLAVQFSAATTGCSSFESHTSGWASSITARSANETAAFLGTISPRVTCRKVTTSSASTKAVTSAAAAGTPRAPIGTTSRWCSAGSDTLRMSREHTVMPSWQTASIWETCSIA